MVSWFNIIKGLIIKKDNSRELKKGEIKQILIQIADETLPEFKFLFYKNHCYTFQRLRRADHLIIYETLHIHLFSKEKNFDCSVASRLTPEYIKTKTYNAGYLSPHNDLKELIQNSGSNTPERYYFNNGLVKTTTKTVREIFQDFKKYGLPFLDKYPEVLKTNEIIKAGFNYIDNLKTDKDILKNELILEINKSGMLYSNIKNPVYLNLKEKLQSIPGQNRRERRMIPRITFELLEIYWSR